MGDVRKNEEGTASDEPLDVPDWSQGPNARPNTEWITTIKKKTCEDIDVVSQQGFGPRELGTHTYYLTEFPRTSQCTERWASEGTCALGHYSQHNVVL